MQVSLNIILGVLQSYQLEKHIDTDNNYTYSKCLPLPDDIKKLRRDCIYVGGLSRALALLCNYSEFNCICVRDRIKDDNETDQRLSGLIIVNENITWPELLSQIVTRFFVIADWLQQMHETLNRNGSMQDIVDLSAPIIDNYFAVCDSSQMLLAYTKSIPCDDPICVSLVKNGYHSEEVIQTFRKHNLLRTWDMADSIFVDDTCQVAKYETLHKIFRFRNVYFAHVVLTCNRNPITPCLRDLFQIFIDVLSIYIERMCEEKTTCNHVYDTFLTDLIEGSITSRKVIEERAQYVGILPTGNFYLFQIVPSESANLTIGKMLLEFSDLFPRFKFIRYRQSLVAIHHFLPRDVDEQMIPIGNNLEMFLQKYDASCGVSLFFFNLEDIHCAFRQSSLAMKYAEHLRGREIVTDLQLTNQDSRIHFFSRKYIYCLLGESEVNKELWFHSDYHRKLQKLYEHDIRQKSNYIQLLHIYLKHEQNATEAGNALKVHRNNVVYHINRIKEMLELDFTDPSVRFLMQVSIILIELYGFSSDR